MDVYDKSIQDVQKYLQCLEINFRDEYPISFSFFKEIKDTYEVIKVEVHSNEFISKEDIQEFLVKPSKEFSLYTTFIHKFMIGVENYKECNITFNINKEQVVNSWEQRTPPQHEAWCKIFIEKEDNCTIFYFKFANIRISKLVIFIIFI